MHVINVKDFDNYKGSIRLASDSSSGKVLDAVVDPSNDSIHYEVYRLGNGEASVTCSGFTTAVEEYNKLR